MPRSHREHAEWTPSRILNWASKVGPSTRMLCEAILQHNHHPEWGYRSCLGIFRLSKRYGFERLERACLRAHGAGARFYKSVASILERGLDKEEGEPTAVTQMLPLEHENIRGGSYYH